MSRSIVNLQCVIDTGTECDLILGVTFEHA